MSKLPLKVQLGIRDSWDKEDAPVRKAIKKLEELIGLDMIIEPEWPLLTTELDGFFPDKTTFVPSIAGCVVAWCTALYTLLDDGADEDWADTLLERLNGRLKVFLEVSKDKQLEMNWSAERAGFIIALPKGPISTPMEVGPLFKGRLVHCFEEKAAQATPLSHRPAPVDDWADVSMDTATGKPAVVYPPHPQPAPAVVAPSFDVVPHCSTLPRPDELLLKPPYHLVVYDRGKTLVEVHGSHSPSLQLLAEYLKKWCRMNHQDTRNPPGVEVKLHQSAFGLGLVYDQLTLSVEGRFSSFAVTPMIVLNLVEGVLGYKSVSVDGDKWRYRKDVEFRKPGY